MRVRVLSFFPLHGFATAAQAARAQSRVPEGVVPLTTDQFEWQDSRVGWEMAEL